MNSLQQTINKITIEWNEIFEKNFNSIDHAIGLQPNNKFDQKNLKFFLECKAELEKGADFLVHHNHDTFHEGLHLFSKVVDQSKEISSRLALSAELLANSLTATKIDFPILQDQVKKLELVNESSEILSSLETISLELTKAEKTIESRDITMLADSLSCISRHFLILECKENCSFLPHLSEMKARYEKLKALLQRSLQLQIESCIENPADNRAISRLFSILGNANEEELKNVYNQAFTFLKEGLPLLLAKKLKAMKLGFFKTIDSQKILQLDSVEQMLQGEENHHLNAIFNEICIWFHGILKFCHSFLRIGGFTAGMQPFDLNDALFILIQQLKTLASHFIQLPLPKDSSLDGFYLNDLESTGHFCNSVNDFTLPKELVIRNVEFSSTSFLYKRALSQEGEEASENLASIQSLASICSSIAPKNIFYLSVYQNLFKFFTLLETDSKSGKLPGSLPTLFEFGEFVRSLWLNSFCSSFASLVNEKLRSLFGHSSFFDGIVLNDESASSKQESNKYVFKCIPQVEEIARLCSILIVHSQIQVKDEFLQPFFLEKVQFILNKFESLYSFLFGQKFSASNGLVSKAAAKAILDSSPFACQLDLQQQNSLAELAMQKEFIVIFQLKRDRALRREEILDLSPGKADKVALFFTSMLHLREEFSSILKYLQKNDLEIQPFEQVFSTLNSLAVRAIYTLRIELRIQCVYYLELLFFDNSEIDQFLEQFIAQLAYLDAIITKMAGVSFAQLLFSGLPGFVNEVLQHAYVQIHKKDEEIMGKIRKSVLMLQHGFVNLCSSSEPLLIEL